MKGKFSFLERFVLLSMLPKEGDFTTLKLLRTFKEELSLSEDENKVLKPELKDGIINWNAKADVPKEISVPMPLVTLIQDIFRRLDDEKKLNEQHLDLYEKFMM